MPEAQRTRPLWWLGWVVFVVYGSLLPFDFTAMPLDVALEHFIHLPFLQLGVESRADWVANGVLYLPVGALTAQWLIERWNGRTTALALLLATAFGVALAVAVEFAQEFFPPRTVSQNDLIAECLGSALGALAMPLLLPFLRRLGSGWRLGGPLLARHALEAYALAYLALSFFPFDLLLNADEWQAKLASGNAAWWLAAPTLERGWLGGLMLLVEIGLSLPYGLLLGLGLQGPPVAPGRQGRPVAFGRAALWGLALGLLIEGGQLTLASGVSQGASVLTRSLGLVLGAWCAAQGVGGIDRAREQLRRHALPVQALHAVLVLAASGWFSHGLRTVAQVGAQWRELHLMPFYYHYFTSEAEALFSLGSVALMYVPVALVGWALRRPARADVILAAALALFNETGKLFIDGLHPDPSNVVIALVACGAVRLVLRRAKTALPGVSVAAAGASAPGASASPAAAFGAHPPASAAPAPGAALALALGLVGAALAQALAFPAWPFGLTGLIALAALAVAYRPPWALVLLPAAMPVLDLAPLSGRTLWDEFDLLQLALLAVLWLRTRATARAARPPLSLALKVTLWLLGASLLLGLLRGGWPWAWPDANAWLSPHSPYNALRIAKGALWAGVLLWLMRRLALPGQASLRLLGAGLIAGLILTLAVLLWERAAFASLVDFEGDYRVTGPFSAMHTGGATVECFLAMASAMALAALLAARRTGSRLALSLLLLAATYGMALTFSRNGYAALGVAASVLALVQVLPALRSPAAAGQGWRRPVAAAAVLAAMLAAAAPVLLGGFAQQRLAQSGQDLALRQAHWSDALALRDGSALTALFGAGLGTFPALHFWRSAEPAHAGVFSLVADPRQPQRAWLRLGAGTPVYLEQLVAAGPGQRLRLTARVRAAQGASLGVALCEKWLLSSAQCAAVTAEAPPATAPGAASTSNGERMAQWLIDTSDWTATPLPRPVKLSLHHADGSGTVEVAQVELTDESGQPLLRNGDFAHGFDHWFFSTDVDPPWHVHQWLLSVLLEQGWFGVLTWVALLALALGGAARRALRGDLGAAGVLAALLAFVASGLLNSLTDTPRMLWLVLLLLWMGAAGAAPPPRPGNLPPLR